MKAALLVLLIALAPFAAAQQTSIVPELREAPSCGFPPPVLFAKAPAGVAFENLAFDGNGTLYLTAFDNGLWRAFPNGTLEFVVKDVRPLPDPDGAGPDSHNAFMGVDLGPNGDLFVSQGLSVTNTVAARVLRFPVAGEPSFEVYAEGFDGANGLAVTPDGVVYLAHGFREQIWRIPEPNKASVWARATSPNGLVEHPDGARLVYSQVTDGATTVRAISLADPARRETLLTFNAAGSVEDPLQIHLDRPLLTKGFDDLVVDPQGVVYGAAHLRLQVVRGDPATSRVCIAMDKQPGRGPTGGEPASVRFARGFGDWDGKLFSVDFAGEVLVIDVGAEPSTNSTDPEGEGTDPAAGVSRFSTPAPAVGVGLALVLGLAWGTKARRS